MQSNRNRWFEADSSFVTLLRNREIKHTTLPQISSVIDSHLHNAERLYRKNLFEHFGCVNAIEFSNNGRFMLSAGDDRRVVLWDVHKTIHGQKYSPITMQAEHRSNVFVVAFDSMNTKLFSGGNDDQVIIHDTETAKPLDYIMHDDPVYGISVDPLNDSVFATACDNGQLLIHDIRDAVSTAPFCLANVPFAFHAVMFNPVEPRLLVSASTKIGICLWDVRMPKKTVLNYGGKSSAQCCMSAKFSKDGSKIIGLRRRLPPVLYSTKSTNHLFQFTHAGYYNSCTMKSCCFAGSNDQYIISGSDNFDLYVWRIPTEIPEPLGDERLIQNAHHILRGHRSIVNQVRYNSTYSVIASSGVEKVVKLWSPFPLPSPNAKSSFETSDDYQRRIYTNEEYINIILQSGQFLSLTYDTSRRSTREDPRMLAFFDALVQRDLDGMSEDDEDLSPRDGVSDSENALRAAICRHFSRDSDRSDRRHSNADRTSDPEPNENETKEGNDGSDVKGEIDCKKQCKNHKQRGNGTLTNNRDVNTQTQSDPEPISNEKENHITRIITKRQPQLLRMARNHIRMEVQGNTTEKKKRCSTLQRLRRLTHSLSRTFLPPPDSVSPSLVSESHSSSSFSTPVETDISSLSSDTSSSDDDGKPDTHTAKRHMKSRRKLPRNSETRSSSSLDHSENEVKDKKHKKQTCRHREKLSTSRNHRRKQRRKESSSEDEADEDKPCTSAQAMKRQKSKDQRKRRSPQPRRTSLSSSPDDENNEASLHSQTANSLSAKLARLERVSKELLRVSDGVKSTLCRLSGGSYRRNQQSTMISSSLENTTSASSSSDSTLLSSTSTTTSSDEEIDALDDIPLAKRRKLPSAVVASKLRKNQKRQENVESPNHGNDSKKMNAPKSDSKSKHSDKEFRNYRNLKEDDSSSETRDAD